MHTRPQTRLRSLSALVTLLITASLAGPIYSQAPLVRRASESLCNAVGSPDATIQRLATSSQGLHFTATLQVNGKDRTYEFKPERTYDDNFRLWTHNEHGVAAVPGITDAGITGSIDGSEQHHVKGTRRNNRLHLTLRCPEGTSNLWRVEPLSDYEFDADARDHLVYRVPSEGLNAFQLAALPATGNTANYTPSSSTQSAPAIASNNPIHRAQLAFDCDFQLYQSRGGVGGVIAYYESLVASMNLVWMRDMSIQFVISNAIIRTSPTYGGTDVATLLPEFRQRWMVSHSGTVRDFAILASGRAQSTNVVASAYASSICGTNAYGVVAAGANIPTSYFIHWCAGTAFGATSCSVPADPGCGFMCSSGACSIQNQFFRPLAIQQIQAFRDTRTCLQRIFPPTLSHLVPNTIAVAPRPTVTLHGSYLDELTELTVGGQPTPIISSSNAQITFVPPLPASLHPQAVVTANIAGQSNSIDLSFTPSTGTFAVSPTSFTGGFVSFSFAGAPSHLWAIYLGFHGAATVPFLGFDVLQTGFVAVQGALDSRGVGSFTYNVPASTNMAGITMHSQVIQVMIPSPGISYISQPRPTTFIF